VTKIGDCDQQLAKANSSDSHSEKQQPIATETSNSDDENSNQ